MGEVTPYDKAMYSDMQNGRVQIYGDTAILTYNFAGLRRGADGKVDPSLAKSTRVYVKQGGKWMLVHANFAPVGCRPLMLEEGPRLPKVAAPSHRQATAPCGPERLFPKLSVARTLPLIVLRFSSPRWPPF